MFRNEHHVIHCLVTYTDWWQPPTGSIVQVGAARRSSDHPDGFNQRLLETLDERTELCRRVWQLKEADRWILFLWYVQQFPVEAIARTLDISRRQCFRRRGKAIRAIVEADQPREAA